MRGEHSLYNTPPVFAIYVVMLVTRWLRDEIGGLEAMHARNRAKAGLLYDAIDATPSFYRGHADPRVAIAHERHVPPADRGTRHARSSPRPLRQGLAELRGHRSVGGIRASIYNAMPVEGVEQLAAFMRAFAAANG